MENYKKRKNLEREIEDLKTDLEVKARAFSKLEKEIEAKDEEKPEAF
jgi:septal ring factor EnvC (AmiA/AmiB activator)